VGGFISWEGFQNFPSLWGFVYYDEKLHTQHLDQIKKLRETHRLVSLSMYGKSTEQKRLFAASWQKRTSENPGEEQKFSGPMSRDQLEAWFKKRSREGFTPQIVTSCGTGLTVDPFTFYGVVEKTDRVAWVDLELTPDEFNLTCQVFRGWHMPLRWATFNETVTGVQTFAAIWVEDKPAPKHKSSHGNWWYRLIGPPFDDGRPTLKQAFDAHLRGGVRVDVIIPLRPVMPKPYPNKPPGFHTDRYLVVWRDDQFPPGASPILSGNWWCDVEMSQASFEMIRAGKRMAGFEPIRVGVTKTYIPGSPKPAHFSAVYTWAARDKAVSREWKVTYPPGEGPVLGPSVSTVAAFDGWMKRVMQAYGIRCGSLAIVKNQRLAFARSYKWAEPDYRDPRQTDLYRIGSISKWITGIAAMAACDRKLLALNTNVRDILGSSFRRLNGTSPTADQYDKLTVDHLLRHVGGFQVDVNGVGIDFFNQHLTIRDAFKKAGKSLTWPAQPNEILRHVASLDRDAFANKTRMPGDFFAYSAVDTQLLMHVCARAAGFAKPDLAAHVATMKKLLFDPLGITRVSPIRGIDQVRDEGFEVQAHLAMPDVARSDFTPDRPWLPWHYANNWDQGPAAGGWLMSAVDLARILAALDLFSDDLLKLTSQSLLLWAPPPVGNRPLNDLAGNTRRHAFYYGQFPSPAGGAAGDVVGHNGAIGGAQALAFIRRDGLAMAVLFNGDFVVGTDHNGKWAGQVDPYIGVGLGPSHAFELNALANSVSSWRRADLFKKFDLPPVKKRKFKIKPKP
jgi:CubicO group peptidase (beta-lactamase class C family)